MVPLSKSELNRIRSELEGCREPIASNDACPEVHRSYIGVCESMAKIQEPKGIHTLVSNEATQTN